MEDEANNAGDLEQSEVINERINELREKAILLKNLTIIQENEKEVNFLISLMSLNINMMKRSGNLMIDGNSHYLD